MDPQRKKFIVTEITKWKHNNLLEPQYCDFLLALYTEGNTPSKPIKNKELSFKKSNLNKIIITEIEKWKQNQMLPSHYCDYLLAFYTLGKKHEIRTIGQVSYKKEYLYFLLIIPIVLIFFYFTKLEPTMQIAFVVFLVFLGFGITYYFFKKGKWFQIPLAVSAFLILMFSVQWITGVYPENMTSLYSTVLANCGLWLLFGLFFRMITFTVSGIIGAVLVLVFMFL